MTRGAYNSPKSYGLTQRLREGWIEPCQNECRLRRFSDLVAFESGQLKGGTPLTWHQMGPKLALTKGPLVSWILREIRCFCVKVEILVHHSRPTCDSCLRLPFCFVSVGLEWTFLPANEINICHRFLSWWWHIRNRITSYFVVVGKVNTVW